MEAAWSRGRGKEGKNGGRSRTAGHFVECPGVSDEHQADSTGTPIEHRLASSSLTGWLVGWLVTRLYTTCPTCTFHGSVYIGSTINGRGLPSSLLCYFYVCVYVLSWPVFLFSSLILDSSLVFFYFVSPATISWFLFSLFPLFLQFLLFPFSFDNFLFLFLRCSFFVYFSLSLSPFPLFSPIRFHFWQSNKNFYIYLRTWNSLFEIFYVRICEYTYLCIQHFVWASSFQFLWIVTTIFRALALILLSQTKINF